MRAGRRVAGLEVAAGSGAAIGNKPNSHMGALVAAISVPATSAGQPCCQSRCRPCCQSCCRPQTLPLKLMLGCSPTGRDGWAPRRPWRRQQPPRPWRPWSGSRRHPARASLSSRGSRRSRRWRWKSGRRHGLVVVIAGRGRGRAWRRRWHGRDCAWVVMAAHDWHQHGGVRLFRYWQGACIALWCDVCQRCAPGLHGCVRSWLLEVRPGGCAWVETWVLAGMCLCQRVCIIALLHCCSRIASCVTVHKVKRR